MPFDCRGWVVHRSRRLMVVVQRNCVSDVVRLCTTPGPSHPVDGVKGGAGGALQSLSWSRTVVVVGGWWRASVGNGAIGAARLCAMPGPLDPVDKGMEGVRLVASDHGRRGGGTSWWWRIMAVAIGGLWPDRSARSLWHPWAWHWRFPCSRVVSSGGCVPHEHGGGQRTFTPWRWCWTIGWRLGHIAVAHTRGVVGFLRLLVMW